MVRLHLQHELTDVDAPRERALELHAKALKLIPKKGQKEQRRKLCRHFTARATGLAECGKLDDEEGLWGAR